MYGLGFILIGISFLIPAIFIGRQRARKAERDFLDAQAEDQEERFSHLNPQNPSPGKAQRRL